MKKIISFALTAIALSVPVLSHAEAILVIDAGSSGSRIHLYDRVGDETREIQIKDNKIKLGLSHYAQDPQAAAASLLPLYAKAATTLNQHNLPLNAELNVLATAGMRLLPEAQQTAIYQAIADQLNSSLEYTYQLRSARTISGTEEAVYAWVAANEDAQNFSSIKPGETEGIVEIGGASMQVAYAQNSKQPVQPDNIKTLTIKGQTYQVYGRSVLGFGQDEVAKSIDNPAACLPKGYSTETVATGDFNVQFCSDSFLRLFQENAQQLEELKLPEDKHFYGLSGYYYTNNFLTPKTSKALRLTISGGVCAQEWTDLQEAYPQESAQYLSGYCRNGLYSSLLLTDVFKLAPTSAQIEAVKKINGISVDWSYGYVIAN